jgi:misacylated tRNA(Ala) deacylase
VLLWGGVRTRIAGTRKGDELYLIPVEGDPVPPPGTAVRGALDDERRTALMRTHSGLHVLTGVVLRDFGAKVTGGNMEPLTARMDFDLAEVPADFKDRVAEAVNAEIAADRRIEVRTLPRAEAYAIPDLIRTATDLLPPDIEEVRIVDIVGLDLQADGGTHVGLDGDGRPGRGGQDGEQGPRVPPAAHPHRLTCRSRAGSGRAPGPGPGGAQATSDPTAACTGTRGTGIGGGDAGAGATSCSREPSRSSP